MNSKQHAQRALNQLLSLIVGSRFAKETDHMKDEPLKRVYQCHRLITIEQDEAFGDIKKMNQINRKLDALKSLTVLAQLEENIDWE